MAEILIDNQHLVDIATSLRSHLNTEDTYKPRDMVSTIQGLAVLPPEAFVFTGQCYYTFAYDAWNWFIEAFGDRIEVKDVTSAVNMFFGNDTLKTIPFDIKFKDGLSNTFAQMFCWCQSLERIEGDIYHLCPFDAFNGMFYACSHLRELPNFIDYNFSNAHVNTYNATEIFFSCSSLRSINEDFLKELWSKIMASYNTVYRSMFDGCYNLNEIKGLFPVDAFAASNAFDNTFTCCNRLKEVQFAVQEDGTPYVRDWANQTFDLSQQIGYCPSANESRITGWNSGITVDKKVVDDTTYQALKNDPDWYATDTAYSRYNHDSAVNTINSLPDCSARGGNIIKFKGECGSATDGGAINTLTDTEIAVAAAKGWTVTLV